MSVARRRNVILNIGRRVADAGAATSNLCSIAGDVFVLRQDKAPPAHRSRDAVQLVRLETPQLIIPDM